MTDTRKRQPKGVPTGGEFAANAHDEAGSSLAAASEPRSSTFEDVKITYTDYGDGIYTAEAHVHKNLLPEWNTRLNEADEDGFLPVASWNTGNTSDEPRKDIDALARATAVRLQRKIEGEDYRARGNVAFDYSLEMEGVKGDPREVEVVPQHAVDEAFEMYRKLSSEDNNYAGLDPQMRAAMEVAAKRAISDQREGFANTDTIAREELVDRLPGFVRTKSGQKVEALIERAARNGADMVEKRREAQVDRFTARAIERSGVDGLYDNDEDNDKVRSLISSAAREANTQVWTEKVGTYPEIAKKGISHSSAIGWYQEQSADKRALIDDAVQFAVISGHSESLNEYVAEHRRE